MPVNQLRKHPNESYVYTFEFSPTAQAQGTPRSKTWVVDPLLSGEGFVQSWPMPLWAQQMATASTATITQSKDVVGSADLTIGTPTIAGTQVTARISGGTTGTVYTITVTGAGTTSGNTACGQGTLIVNNSLA